MKKFFAFVGIALLAILGSGCAGMAAAPAAESEPRTLSVTGTGRAVLTPDIAYVSIGVRTEKKTASEALRQNNARAQRVIDTLTGFGVKEEDIRTTNFSVWLSRHYDNDGKVVSTTYVVQNTVYVTVRNLDTLGDLLDAVVQAGANDVDSIQFDVADKTAALAAAQRAAVENARAQAENVAAAAGVDLGEVQTISFASHVPQTVDVRKMDFAMAAAESSVPVQAGQMTITVTVSMVYGLR